MIKLSKKAAAALGESFAISLHSYQQSYQRGVVIDNLSNISNLLDYKSRMEIFKSYYAKLDQLEPLPSSKRAETHALLGI